MPSGGKVAKPRVKKSSQKTSRGLILSTNRSKRTSHGRCAMYRLTDFFDQLAESGMKIEHRFLDVTQHLGPDNQPVMRATFSGISEDVFHVDIFDSKAQAAEENVWSKILEKWGASGLVPTQIITRIFSFKTNLGDLVTAFVTFFNLLRAKQSIDLAAYWQEVSTRLDAY